MKRGVAAGLAGLAVAGNTTVALSQTVGFKTIMSSLVETRSIGDSDVIPAPQPTFGGTIEKDIAKSTGWWLHSAQSNLKGGRK
jgi:hypothetical protein